MIIALPSLKKLFKQKSNQVLNMSLMNLFISSLVQSAAQAMGDNSTHTLHVEESTLYVNEYMNPTSIAKGIHVLAGAFLIYWILRLKYATVSH